MSKRQQWHITTKQEMDYSIECVESLRKAGCAAPLIKKIDDQGGPRSPQCRSLLFEARFVHELHRCGIAAQYEHKAGVGDSRIDFAIQTDPDLWLVELVIAEETQAVGRATYEQELMGPSGDALGVQGKFLELRSDAVDQKNTIAGEMLKLQEKLYEKVEQGGKPHKFPLPAANVKHAILIDARGFAGGDGPCNDELMQLVYGPENVKDQRLVQFFGEDAVLGIFDVRNKRPGAQLLRERIYLIGFVVEEEFGLSKFQQQVRYRPNPYLTGNESVFDSFPLKRSTPVVVS